MSATNEKCTKCHGDHETGSIYCPKLHDKRITDSTKISLTKSLDNSYIVQIVSIGIRPDNFYEVCTYQQNCNTNISNKKSTQKYKKEQNFVHFEHCYSLRSIDYFI